MTAPGTPRAHADRPAPLASVPPPAAAARVCSVLQDHPRWSAFWDKRYHVWRVAEDDPDSNLYAESSDAEHHHRLHPVPRLTPRAPGRRPPGAPAAGPILAGLLGGVRRDALINYTAPA